MTQAERRKYLIRALLAERPQEAGIAIPPGEQEQKLLLRSLLNLRMPLPVGEEFLTVQDAYLQEEIRRKGITDLTGLSPVEDGIFLWRGDITTLRCDAIVNAVNGQMLGCFCPNHGCVDDAIHTFAGVQLRLACAELMRRQGQEEPAGRAKITPAFNLPSRFVLHTVGPVVRGAPTPRDCDLLASCYRSCLKAAEQNSLKSVAFCCISTGEFSFPNDRAADIAIRTVKEFQAHTHGKTEVIFNVFKETDYNCYRRRLRAD